MRFIGKAFLGLSLIISFLVLLISITAKVQFLDPNFWINSFREASAYSRLDDVLAGAVQKSLTEEGASKKEAQQFSSFFTSSNLQSFTERNIVNVLDYVNAKTSSLVIYFPLDQIPREFREELNITSDQISINKLISTFGRESTPAGEELFIQLRTMGNYLTISLVVAAIFVLIHIFLLYKIELPGKRLVALGVSLIVSGAVALLFAQLLNIQTTNMAADLTTPDKELIQIILGTLAPPLVSNMTKLWTYFAIGAIAAGIACFFLKRRGVSIPNVPTQPKAFSKK